MVRNAILAFSCAALLSLPTLGQTNNPTPADAEKFLQAAEIKINDLTIKGNRSEWVAENFITDDTQEIAAEANEQANGETTALAKQTIQFEKLQLPPELARKMLLLKLSAIAPSNAKDLAEMTRVQASIAGDYGKGKYCPKTGKHAGECLDITKIEHIMETSTDADELKDLWLGWHAVGAPMRQRYARFVELSNEGAREMGWADTGAYWRAGYDMPPDQFSAELERLWQQVRPLYVSLQTYVRNQLVKKYRTAGGAEWDDPRRFAGQSVGAGVGQHLPPGGSADAACADRSDRDLEREEGRRAGDGEVRRELL